LLCFEFQGNDVTPLIFRISVRKIELAGVSSMSFLIGTGPLQWLKCLIIQFFCY
jgi:hypothetical protein